MILYIRELKYVKTIVCWRCHSLKHYSNKKFSSSLNLPKTKFQLSMKDSPSKEKTIQKACGFDDLYKWQWEQKRDKRFVLHDGPPYANGDPHVGHALNKILKDITNRYKLLKGHRIHYVPGWDCHGMPIEQKALSKIRADHTKMDPMEIRKTARKFATRTIKKQKEVFKRWGVMADWNQSYYTYDKQFEACQLNVFFQMYDKGLIYQDYMPVRWSPTARTALAEAELEYNEQHISPSIYMTFQLAAISEQLRQYAGTRPMHLIIWTTTPWTIPLNQAVCYSAGIEYALVETKGRLYVCGANFIQKLSNLVGVEANVLARFKGDTLKGCTYTHPLKDSSLEHPLIEADHVTTEKGTGLVHTAPAHGTDDFQIAIKRNLSLECHVDEAGRYMNSVGNDLAGKHVLTDGNQAVLALLKDSMLHRETFTHSYPYDWRTKTPCIYRASKQWFVNTDQIKQRALECLDEVDVVSQGSAQGMRAMLERRPYWCISRQRVWGVPIPVFYHKDTNQPLITRESVAHIQKLVSEHGTDCWWTLPMDMLLPAHIKQQSGFGADDVFVKGEDALDIWFDSGTTWASVLQDVGCESDVYLEGVDQFGGWFQSSLLTSVASQNKAPYKHLVVHGFTVDEEGRKMSKSIGNVVDPVKIVDGGKDKANEPAYGADVLRWWVASCGLDVRVNIGPTSLERCKNQLFTARKVLRYLIGNLYDFDVRDNGVCYEDLLPTDKYMLHILHDLICKVDEEFGRFRYDAAIRLCDAFINAKASAFYSSITKDRMYCMEAESLERRSCQTVQYYILEALVKVLAPIVPHFSEEIYQHPPFRIEGTDSVFKTSWLEPHSCWKNEEISGTFDLLLNVRNVFYKAIAQEVPVAFDVTISASERLLDELKKVQNEEETHHSSLCEVLQASTVALTSECPDTLPEDALRVMGTCSLTEKDGAEEHEFVLVAKKAKKYICERCRRYTAVKYGTPCDRCMTVLSSGWE